MYSDKFSKFPKSKSENKEKGGVNFALITKLDPAVGNIGFTEVLFLESETVYAMLLDSPFPKVNSPVK